MYLIDQHAAHERILLERMVAAMQARTPLSQLLLTPIILDLAPTEVEAIEPARSGAYWLRAGATRRQYTSYKGRSECAYQANECKIIA
jgi:DNA mismatch repair ATPase MutL